MSTIDEPINELYDDIRGLQRKILNIERSFRELANRDDIAVDPGALTTPADEIALVTESLAALRHTLDTAETRRSDAKQAAARLYIDPSIL